ncbi:MAG: type II toxin-antitoxin system VapC family toxin [Verrucomicrobia subdivision 3 bacterium]|nr:type II toxin-antitoxin system VapC family toxin [Limisphaerales bacterium]
MKYLLDTGVWLRGAKEPETLPTRIRNLLGEPGLIHAVSDISLWEVAMLSAKGRIDLPLPCAEWQRQALRGIRVLPITPEIAEDAVTLARFHPDPADRLITATARQHNLTLITTDRDIRDSRQVPARFFKFKTA